MATEGLNEVFDQPCRVRLGNREFVVSPLTPHDFAEAEAFVRNDRLNAFMEQTRLVKGVNLPDTVRGVAMAGILNRPVSLDEVLSSFTGQLYLLYLSLKKLNPGLTFEAMKSMGPTDIKLISTIMLQITGLGGMSGEEGEQSPLGTSELTSTGEKSVPISPDGKDTLQA